MIEFIKNIFADGKHTYSTLITIITIICIIYTMYTKIKYLCLQKAAEKVAEVEGYNELSGEEKFSLVVCWINKDLPGIFKNQLTKTIVDSIVQFAYDNSAKFASNYIKRKTGYDISKVIENLSKTTDDASEASKKDSNTDNKIK